MSKYALVVPFELSHLKLMDIWAEDAKDLCQSESFSDSMTYAAEGKLALTVLYKKVVLGVLGYYPIWEGTYKVWMLPSKHLSTYGLVYAKVIKRNLNHFMLITRGWHRLQTESLSNSETDRLHQWLGFTEEGVLRRYSPLGKDYKMWAIVKG
jgi:hypothetical protein